MIYYPNREGSVKKAKAKMNQIEKYLYEREILSNRIVTIKGN